MKRLLLLLGVCLWATFSHAQLTAPFTESFNSTSIPTGWTNTSTNTSTNANWKFGGTPGNPSMTSSSYNPPVILDHTQNGGTIAWSDGSSPAVADCGLMTDSIDISGLTSLWLEFWYYSNNITNPGDNNTLYVNFYDGTQWNDSIWGYAGDGPVWQYGAIDLSSYTTSGKVMFEFVLDQTTATTAFYNDVLLDDISVTNVPTCPFPLNLGVSNITSSGADLSWNSVTAATNGYEIIYGLDGFNPATGGTPTTTTNNFITISGLTGATDYDAYIIADCGTTNGISDTAGPIKFTTLCVPFTAPYSRDFDSDPTNVMPLCWDSYWSGSNVLIYVYQFGTVHSSPNHLRLYSGSSTTSDTTMAITPQFSDMTAGNKQITFWANSTSTNNVLYVGTTSDQTGQAAFTPLDTITFSATNTPVEYIIPISTAIGYNGTDQYVAFRHGNNQTFSNIYIDDFLYEVAPPCPKVQSTQLGIAQGATAATVTVQGGGSFQVEWGPVGYAQGTGTFVTGTAPMNLTGMTPSTCYDLYIRRDCSGAGNGFSSWEGPFTFCTTCLPQALPFTENYDTWPLSCWDTIGGSAYWAQQTGTGGDNYAVANFWNNSTGVYIKTTAPIIIDVQAQLHFFWSHLASASYPDDAVMFRVQSLTTGVWDTILYLRAGSGNFNDPTAGNTTPGAFVEEIQVLPASYIGDTIKVEVRGISDFGPNAYLNNFAVEATPNCIPTSLAAITHFATSDSAFFNWNPGAGVKWSVEVGNVGFVPGTGTYIDSVSTIDSAAAMGTFAGNTTYHMYILDSCSDGSISPWVGPYVFTTLCNPKIAPYTENFDGPTWAPGPFSNSNDSIDPCWSRDRNSGFFWGVYDSPTGSSNTGPSGDHTTGSDNFIYAESSPQTNGDTTYFYTPLVDVSALTVPYVSFWYHRYGAQMGDLIVEINDGSGWSPIITLTGQQQSSSTDPYKEIGADISSFGNLVQVRFLDAAWTGCCAGDMAIDDVSFVEAPSCPDPSGLIVTNVIDTAASVSWNPTSSAISYEIWLGPQGFYQGSTTVGGHKIASPTDSVHIDTLRDAFCYEVLVRAICGPGDTSGWVGPVVFCTNCRPFQMPYYQSYDIWPPVCWDVSLGTSDWIQEMQGTDGWAEANFWGISTGNMVMNSPIINVNQDAQVRYTWSHLANTTSYPDDELIVRATVVGSGVWDTLVDRKSGNGNFNDPTAANTSPGTGVEDTWLLDPLVYTGQQVIIQFWGNTDFGPSCFINDFWVEKVPTCFRPDSLAVGTITVNTTDVSWTSPAANPGTSFEVSYGIGLNDPALGTKVLSTSTSTTLTGLTPSSAYCFFVREICATGDTSSWEGPVCWNTPCVAIMAPWSEDFEFHTVGHWDGTDLCWDFISNNPSTSSSGGYSWEVRNTPQNTSGTSTGPDRDNTLFPNQGGVFITADVSGSSTLGPDTTLLVSPVIDISGLSMPELEYHVHRFGTVMADLHVDIFNGTSWVRSVHSYTNQAGIQTSQSAAWTDTTIDLSAYAGTTNLQVRFRSVTNGCCAGDNAIDDVSIYDLGGGVCPAPTGLMANVISCDSIQLNWANGGDTTLVVYGDTVGGTPVVANVYNDTTLLITGTMPNTTYIFAVANICGTDTSMIDSIMVFTDEIGAPTANFTFSVNLFDVNFDASSSTGFGNSYSWDFGDSTTATGVISANTYGSGGSYSVTLTVTNACGSDDTTITVGGVSLTENELSRNLQVYPNPTEGQVTVSFDLEDASGAEIRVMDMSGRQIKGWSFDNLSGTMNEDVSLEGLSEGIYIIEVVSGNMHAYRRITLR